MHFTRLRLQGFKSFVEPTDLDIPAGLTGIVGPNGCGKSNLVEALRWVMGENSARRMRGTEMDDVIFGGTSTRPSRNLAEVMLELDNSGRTAAAEFNDAETLHVTRQIERGSGSSYLINGKPVRQKDVQWLFADQATGAHSTNLVGQGQIDALIRAKPQDRRAILEEASGTAGLHARRHEAELKLKGAEQNLTRLDDVLKTYDSQLRGLKQQVRQASRYKNLAEHIRRTEAALLHLRWLEAERNTESLRVGLQQCEVQVNELLIIVTQGNTARADIAADLPGLRQTEAAAASVVQKLVLAREQIDADMRRVVAETETQENLRTQIIADRDREQSRRADGEAAMVRLQAESAQLAETLTSLATQTPQVEGALSAASAEVEKFDCALSMLMEAIATAEARAKSLQQEIDTLNVRRDELTIKREQLDAQRVALAEEVAARPDLSFAAALVDASETELARRQQQAQDAEQARRDAENIQTTLRDATREAHTQSTRLRAEADAITTILQSQESDSKPVLDLITVAPGMEQALAVALGEALTAALDDTAAMHWRSVVEMSDVPALPEGTTALDAHIQAPPALRCALRFVGLVDDATMGESAAQNLRPGQILVSRDGWAWRWDGYTVTPQAKTTTAVRLQQRNRLEALKVEITAAEVAEHKAEAELQQATDILNACQDTDRQARTALQAAFAALTDARDTYARQEKEATAIGAKLAAADEALREINNVLEDTRVRATACEDQRRDLPEIDVLREDMVQTRTLLNEQRSLQAQYRSECDRLRREYDLATARNTAVVEETQAWQSRLGSAAEHITALTERQQVIEAQLEQLRARPTELEASRGQLLTELSEAEAHRAAAADNLITTEQKLAAVEQKLKQDESALGATREERVRVEGALQTAGEHFSVLRERMIEKLNCAPEELVAIAAFAEGEMPDMPLLEETLARYVRERENMGPVNLRAEVEAETLQCEMDKLQKEKDDLVAAIAKLRQGISQLNKEARERLDSAFSLVNERFQTLFKRLFNGGNAHLELIDNEDPLNAGLEIFASPPGKKMQILSLLSGGERTLTALALLFAVFQTNPSPICVLDEAEAALDESNIGRFCDLVETIARETGTRFLIITHQRLTMAKMDRLYGVTMSEKGVSQLVSVDLAGAVALRDGESLDSVSRAEEALAEAQAA